jgi:hypothetical protein
MFRNRPDARRNSSRRRARVARALPCLEAMESRLLLSTFLVSDTADSGAGSLRQAILDADADPAPGVDAIVFGIPASTASGLNVPVPGFDTGTQDWTIQLDSALPPITRPLSIDGYTQGHVGIPYFYPADISSASQFLSFTSPAVGGTFTLTTSAPLPVGTTIAIPYDATADAVQGALEAVIGTGNVAVSGGPLNSAGVTITFQGADQGVAIPDLTSTNNLIGAGGTTPAIQLFTSTVGGEPLNPVLITSTPNSSPAINGNNAVVRVVVDGSRVPGGASDVGFVLNASDCILRGVAIEGFNVGVSVPSPSDVGDLIQGDFIGNYVIDPVDTQTGAPVPAPNNVAVVGQGNAQQGVLLDSANATVGGTDPQDSNVICGNGAQGVLIQPGASGNQVLGDQIGVVGPISGFYFQDGNGAEGVLIQSSGTAGDPASIVYDSSNTIGGTSGGNVISANGGDGVHIAGVGATRNLVEANYIGAAPGGGYIFGSGDPGNLGDGVFLDDAPDNQVGGPTASLGNVISSNQDNGVEIDGADALGNTILNNIIGLTASGAAVLGNDQAGVADTSPGTTIGPGNVISANLIGVLISGAEATGVLVSDNLIGTDSTGEIDVGNAQQGVAIENSSGNTVQGTAQGAEVISGNQVGVEIGGSTSTQNLVVGNFVGIDKAGTEDRGNADEGVLIAGGFDNTVGGTTAAARNVISANQWGIRVDGVSATGNAIEGNYIGTDVSGTRPLGNEINGVILSNNASRNSIGGAEPVQGNLIAFNVAAGVSVNSGVGDSILSNSIYSNGQQGIVLVGTANDGQSAPMITGAGGGGTTNDVEGSLASVPNTTFLIDFFISPTPDPSGRGQGQNFVGSTSITTDSNGNGSISFDLATTVPVGYWVTATATNQSTGDSSAFSNAIEAQSATVQFAQADVVVNSTAGMATIDVARSDNPDITVTVAYTADSGSASAGQDYTPVSGTLSFPPGQNQESFAIPILANPTAPSAYETVNLTLGEPGGGATLGSMSMASLIIINTTNPNVSSIVVDSTADSGPGTLRTAILAANADPNPGVDNIFFNIPASNAANLDVPAAGFDPVTQTWQIDLASPLPAVTHPVAIDGYTQGNVSVPFRYPADMSSQNDNVALDPSVTGGTYQLTIADYVDRSGVTRGGSTINIPYNATGAYVQSQLEGLAGIGNVTVTGQSQPIGPDFYTVTFTGESTGLAIDMQATSQLLVGGNPVAVINVVTQGGNPVLAPSLITSLPDGSAATAGNDSQVRVVINGSAIPQTNSDVGFVLSTSDSSIRGLAITGFDIGVSVPSPANVGDLIQGNFIGNYLTYPVDSLAGTPLAAPDNVELVRVGNTQQGVVLDSANATLGGTEPQDSNVISGNGGQGVLVQPGASGNQVLGNQIGVVGPASAGTYFQAGNGAEGVLIESSGTAADPAGIVYASSNTVGGTSGGNIISANHGDGVRILGVGATRNLVEANYIGVAPGGTFGFGNAQPGNLGDGVYLDDAPDNQVGGPTSSLGNAISSNQDNGVEINGADAVGDTVLNNIIGLTATGTAALGNDQAGVADTSPGTVIGPGNVISANLIGVLISGAGATGVLVSDNLIGTDSTGEIDLGNAQQGVEIANASGNTVQGTAQGAQVISGNDIGIEIAGSTSMQNLVVGNFVGVDRAGTADRGNSGEGVLIEGAFNNTIGGATAANRNVISANQWGIHIDGVSATGNAVEGNDIGTDVSGMQPLGNEINGVLITGDAADNTIGGTVSGQGNIIAFNQAAGVSVASGIGDSILSNSIFSNHHLGIDLVAPGDPPSGVTPDEPGVRTGPNDLQNYPVIVSAIGGSAGSAQAAFNSLPNTMFLIQFFSSAAADPSGYGQGETLLGSVPVATDSNGNATVNLNLPAGLPAGAWITATATNEVTGDTSEFSSAAQAETVSVQFATSNYAVDATAGFATVQVERLGNATAQISVNYATANGTAAAGLDYTAASGTLTFAPGQNSAAFTVPILANPSQTANSTTVGLSLSHPTGGATLGSIGTATLTIVNNLPAAVEFSASQYSVYAGLGRAVVTVVRTGPSGGPASVGYSTSGGTAVPARDYTPVAGTLTFAVGQASASFVVPVVEDTRAPASPTVLISLARPTGGVALGSISTATLTISEAPAVSATSPAVISETVETNGRAITAIVFGFSKPLDANRADQLSNYGYYVYSVGAVAGSASGAGSAFPLESATYDAALRTVTLIPGAPLALDVFYQVTIDGHTSRFLNNGLTDTYGNLLVGSSGNVGTPFVATFGAGTSLAYADGSGNVVTLKLVRGGLIEVFRAQSGSVEQMQLVGVVAGKTALTGSLRRAPGGSGRTFLPPIRGALGVRVKLKSPPFFIS